MSPTATPISKQDRALWSIVSALVVLVTLLGALPYYWTDQVSLAARTRMQADLQTAMSGFREGLWRELGEVCTAIHPASHTEPRVDAKEYSRRVLQWRERALYPQLMEYVYLWPGAPHPAPQLTRIDPLTGKVQQVEWPHNFATIHGLLLRESSVLSARSNGPMGDFLNPNEAAPGVGSLWGVDQNLPAMVQPVMRHLGERPTEAGETEITWLIILLNPGVLEKQVMPELARREFGASGLLDFKVAILSGDDEHPHALYSSDRDFATTIPSKLDGTLPLWNPTGFPTGPPPTTGPLRELSAQGRVEAAPPEGSIRFLQFHYSRLDRPWQIVVDHRSGSIQEAIAKRRRRDLAVSFGLLLVLTGTIGVLVVTTNRARRLAQLQLDFVTGITHELRTPLAVILSASENIQDGTITTRPQLLRYGDVIHRQAKQLLELVEQILLFSAMRQIRQPIHLEPVEVTKVIEGALEDVDLSGVTLDKNIEPDLPQVAADFGALCRCLRNLITNAIKYGGEKRWIGIQATTSKDAGEDSIVEITINDHGIGIAEAEIPRIFEPFYRSPNVAASNIHGTGLGLPLAKTTAEEMGGYITVVSERGVGTSFTLHLPALNKVRAASADR